MQYTWILTSNHVTSVSTPASSVQYHKISPQVIKIPEHCLSYNKKYIIKVKQLMHVTPESQVIYFEIA